ncbi:MAG: hypothetical protein RIB60_09130 [Phycisphaerales bacterium]
MRGRRRAWRRGLTMVEAVISTLLVAGLMVAAMDAVGASVVTREKIVQETRGQQLADSMLQAISNFAYTDPDGGLDLGVIKIESGEETGAGWGRFDDVDDFDGWSASPPQARDGSALPGYSKRWTRSVEVALVRRDSLDDIGLLSGGEGVKRIVVSVTRDGAVVGRAVALRTLGTDLARAGESPAADDGGGLLDPLGGILTK